MAALNQTHVLAGAERRLSGVKELETVVSTNLQSALPSDSRFYRRRSRVGRCARNCEGLDSI